MQIASKILSRETFGPEELFQSVGMRPFRVEHIANRHKFGAEIVALSVCLQIFHCFRDCFADLFVEFRFSEPKLKTGARHYHVNGIKSLHCVIRTVLVEVLCNCWVSLEHFSTDNMKQQFSDLATLLVFIRHVHASSSFCDELSSVVTF